MAANYADSDEEEIDIEGDVEQDDWTGFRDSTLQGNRTDSPEKGLGVPTLLPSASVGLFSDCCDPNLWLDSMWSLDHCEDEKSRAAIAKMILEEEMYLQRNSRKLEHPCSAASLQTKEGTHVKKNNSSATKQKAKVRKAAGHHTRKPWTDEEQNLFEEGMRVYGRSWTRIAAMIEGRTSLQVKNFANYYFKTKCLGVTRVGARDSCTDIGGNQRDTESKEHTPEQPTLSTHTRDGIENVVNGEMEDDCDSDIDIDGDDDTASNPLIPGHTLAPDEIYTKLVQSALQEGQESHEDSDGGCSSEEVVLSNATLCENPEPLETPAMAEKFQKSAQHNPTLKDPAGSVFGNEKDQACSEAQIEPSCTLRTRTDDKTLSRSSNKEDIAIPMMSSDGCNMESCRNVNNIQTREATDILMVDKQVTVQQIVDKVTDMKEIVSQSDLETTQESKNGLRLSQRPTTPSETAAAMLLPSNERSQPIAGAANDLSLTSSHIVIQRDTIHDKEKIANSEFFMGRSLKTPERYMKIRNYILDMWQQTKPHYLFKTSVRSGLKSCGDVNSIGRVHAFLEDINAINVDCPEMPQPRHARVRNDSESDKRKDAPLESWVSVLRPRKRRIHTVKGEWIDESEAEGVTITHLSGEEEETDKDLEDGKSSPNRPRRLRPRPSSYDPFQLIPCRKFPSASAVPFDVYLSPNAVVVMDTHAHMSTSEVIGLLGGKYDSQSRNLEVLEASPCDSLSTGMQCEMDPVSQTRASESLAERGFSVVGWYHSHPTFAASPSIRDIETQAKFQEWFSKGGAPFVGVIVSPYNYTNTSNQSQLTCLTVSDRWNTTGQYRLPYQFVYNLLSESADCSQVLEQLQDLAQRYREKNSRVRMSARCSGTSGSAFTALDKLLESIFSRLTGAEDSKKLFVEKAREVLTEKPDEQSTVEHKLQATEWFATSEESQLSTEEKPLFDRSHTVSLSPELELSLKEQDRNCAAEFQNKALDFREESHHSFPLVAETEKLLKRENQHDWQEEANLLTNCLLLGAEEVVMTSEGVMAATGEMSNSS